MADVKTAVDAGSRVSQAVDARPVAHWIAQVHPNAIKTIVSPREYNPLIQQEFVFDDEYYTNELPLLTEKIETKEK